MANTERNGDGLSTYMEEYDSFISRPGRGLGRAPDDGVNLRLRGVDHSARPTWKLIETVEFYRDVLGLPMVHVI